MVAEGAQVLVIGAGPAGMRAALDLADLGARVTMIERKAAPGGTLTQLDVQYPTIDCGACQVQESLAGPPWPEPKCLRTGLVHPLITTLTSTTLRSADRAVDGGFQVTLERGRRWIDPERCSGCGDCAAICPAKAVDEHQGGTCSHSAAHRLHALTDPPIYTIDEVACTRCGDCLPRCPERAIDLDRQPEELSLAVDAVIVAAGFTPFDPALQPQWAYGRHPDVVTGLELERLIRPRPGGGLTPLLRRSDGQPVERVAFVQCVGSRDTEHPYCSAICCMYALKEAILLREALGVEECHLYAIDLRCLGKGYEQTLDRALAAGVRIVHARPGAVEATSPGERPTLRIEAPGLAQRREPYDLVVLSVGLTPSAGMEPLAAALGVELDGHGFLRTEPLSTVRTSQPGVFACGAAAGPADIPWSITQASQAALLAAAHAGLPRRAPSGGEAGSEEPRRQPPRAVPLTALSPTQGLPILEPQRVIPRALILGAGPAGLAAAHTIARAGFEAIVVEREEVAGGNLRQARRLASGDAPEVVLAAALEEVRETGKVELLLGWELVDHRGGPGSYSATVRDRRTGRERKVRHGALIVATGAAELDPGDRHDHDRSQRVITQRALEALLASGDPLPAEAPTVVMIQCVGSREPARPVCSRVCCHEALKNALWLKERSPGARVFILHRDLRALGFDELTYERARTQGVIALRVPDDAPPEVTAGAEGAVVRFRDPLLGRRVRVEADLVVLSAAMVPNLSAREAEALGLEAGLGGFLTEANVKFRPVEASRRGVLIAGTAAAPVLIPEAIAQGEAAGLRAIARLSRDVVTPRPSAAAYRAKWCAACGLCVEACPVGARELDKETPELGAIIHVGLCQGCGACAAACPSGCSEQPALDTKAVLKTLEAALEVLP